MASREVKKFDLPNKPSEILLAALADFDKIRAMADKYEIRMGQIHSPVIKPAHGGYAVTCQVCMAGSVIAVRAETDPGADISMAEGASGDQELAKKLWFISDVALGDHQSDRWAGIGDRDEDGDNQLRWDNDGNYEYGQNPDAWRRYYLGVVKQFEERGL